MKVGKPTSKRKPVRLRESIQKASAAKQRKNRKLAKKNPEWRSKTKKDPGIPNLFPYKDRILAEIEATRRLKEEDNVRRRQLAKEQKSGGGAVAEAAEDFEEFDAELLDEGSEDDDTMDVDSSTNTNPMAALLASAKARAADFDRKNGQDNEAMDDGETSEGSEDEDGDTNVRKDTSRKQFDKVYKQVVDLADVVLYVLDARDPIGTRSKEVEQMVMAADKGSKRMIFILNKIDLVPPPVLRSWLNFLRRSFPTLPLRASKSAPNAKTFEHKDLTMKGTSESLFKALKTFAESRQLKRSVKVGIIGYPNVGKSSVINALTSRMSGRGAAAPVGAEAGVTTTLREVKLDGKLKLLDSPGIIFANVEGSKESKLQQQARLILLNAVPPKEINDPVPAVALLLKRLSSSDELFSKLMEVYDLPALHSVGGDKTTDFLVQVARKRGRLGRGGVPNLHSAAQTVINDWRDGRIQGWTSPPKFEPAAADPTKTAPATKGLVGDQKEIVKTWAAEFKLDGLWGDELTGNETTEAMEL